MKSECDYMERNAWFVKSNSCLLYLLAFVLAVLWFLPFRAALTPAELSLWHRVRSAEDYMYELRMADGSATSPEYDPWRTGLIGVEWSPVTTTLGSLESKRTACDPRWSVVAGRWFDELGLSKGDSVVVYSSGSFPGILLNVICAAEDRGLDISLAVSLGASTWGANDPSLVLPEMGEALRRGGFISTVPSFYTLGGGRELGGGIAPEGIAVLENAADEAGVKIEKTENLEEMIDMKLDFLKSRDAKLLINIGGSSSSLGSDEAILGLPGGLILPERGKKAGNGVVAGALDMGIPIMHFLNLRELCELTSVPYDSKPGLHMSKWDVPLFSIAGIIIFLFAIFRYKRWSR